MGPNKIGQVAKFYSPLTDENPDQLYVLIEIIKDKNRKEHSRTLFVN